jgi:hypothetical protein
MTKHEFKKGLEGFQFLRGEIFFQTAKSAFKVFLNINPLFSIIVLFNILGNSLYSLNIATICASNSLPQGSFEHQKPNLKIFLAVYRVPVWLQVLAFIVSVGVVIVWIMRRSRNIRSLSTSASADRGKSFSGRWFKQWLDSNHVQLELDASTVDEFILLPAWEQAPIITKFIKNFRKVGKGIDTIAEMRKVLIFLKMFLNVNDFGEEWNKTKKQIERGCVGGGD